MSSLTQEEARKSVKNIATAWNKGSSTAKTVYKDYIMEKSHPKSPMKAKFGTGEFKKPRIL